MVILFMAFYILKIEIFFLKISNPCVDIVLEFFHDDDIDIITLPDDLNQDQNFTQHQGLIHEMSLHLFYEKKFNRCPEQYFVNTVSISNMSLSNLLIML